MASPSRPQPYATEEVRKAELLRERGDILIQRFDDLALATGCYKKVGREPAQQGGSDPPDRFRNSAVFPTGSGEGRPCPPPRLDSMMIPPPDALRGPAPRPEQAAGTPAARIQSIRRPVADEQTQDHTARTKNEFGFEMLPVVMRFLGEHCNNG
jgi:hypothetical protein